MADQQKKNSSPCELARRFTDNVGVAALLVLWVVAAAFDPDFWSPGSRARKAARREEQR
jgi:hypothetical protein